MWDISTPPPSRLILGENFDIVLSLFTLSAIHPRKHVQSMLNMRRMLKPGGRILFRDFALGDETMLKHENRTSDSVFKRKDGTLAVYFTVNDLFAVTRAADLVVVQHSVCCVVEHNRKTCQTRKRCFLHAVLEAPPRVRRVLDAAAVDELLDLKTPPPPYSTHEGRVVIRGKLRGSEADKWEAVLRDINTPPVVSLDISQGCTEAILSRLLTAVDVSLLQELSVEDNKLRFTPHWPSFTSLRSLCLSGNIIDGRECERLCRWLPAAPHLVQFSARNCWLCVHGGDEAFLNLAAAAVSCKSLRTLDLGQESRLSSQSFFTLASILETSHLHVLTLDGLVVLSSPQCCFSLGRAVGKSSIEKLSVASCRIDDGCLEALVRGLSLGFAKSAFTLVLDFNSFTTSSPLHRLLAKNSRVHLVGLSLGGCRLSPRSYVLLAGRIAISKYCQYLNLQDTALPAAFVTVLTTRLGLAWQASVECPSAAHNATVTPPLTHLILSANAIGARVCHRLFSLLQTHVNTHPLRIIQMLNCLPGPVGLASINALLETDRRLLRLEMRVSDDCVEVPLNRQASSQRTLFFIEWPMQCKIAFLSAIRKPSRRPGGLSRYALDADSILPIFAFLTSPVARQLKLI